MSIRNARSLRYDGARMTISSIPAPLRLGPYELLRRLATGGMAEVYLARRAGPHGFQKLVAVKRILPQFASDNDFVAMFVDEARVCARLGHPNIVQVFDFGEHDGELYMAMEYVDGTTGARLIRAAAGRGDEIPLDVALHVALSVLRALEYAHNARDEDGKPLDLVHRDVSPGNVLIDRSGAVKLTDFGIARAAEIERRTDAGQLKGKLGYMYPSKSSAATSTPEVTFSPSASSSPRCSCCARFSRAAASSTCCCAFATRIYRRSTARRIGFRTMCAPCFSAPSHATR
jgi:serine/threonine protein kinase